MTRSSSTRRAFTLIELLVVIGIISVLISILLPTLSAARERGRRVKCLANLRSLGLGMRLYAEDHRDRLPNTNPPGTGIDYDASNFVLTNLSKLYVRSPGVFHCPSDQDPQPETVATADYTLPNSARVSYDFYSVFWVPEKGPKLTKLKDAPLAWDLSAGSKPPAEQQNHANIGGNVVFADGHADWQPTPDWDGPNWPSPAKLHYQW